MQKIKKKIKTYMLSVAMLLCIALPIHADIITGTYLTTAPTNALIRGGGALVSTVTIYTTNALGTMVHFYDSGTNNTPTYVVATYTNRAVYTTNLVNNYTTTTGVTNYLTNLVQISRNYAVPQTTNTFPYVAAYFIPGVNTPYTFTLDAVFARGVAVSNSTAGASIVVNYRRP